MEPDTDLDIVAVMLRDEVAHTKRLTGDFWQNETGVLAVIGDKIMLLPWSNVLAVELDTPQPQPVPPKAPPKRKRARKETVVGGPKARRTTQKASQKKTE